MELAIQAIPCMGSHYMDRIWRSSTNKEKTSNYKKKTSLAGLLLCHNVNFTATPIMDDSVQCVMCHNILSLLLITLYRVSGLVCIGNGDSE